MIGALQTAFYFVIVLGPIVFVHETGHFLFAKLLGIRVEVFSLGFGPRLAGFRRGETDYRLSAVPLGGYVKMTGEMGGEEEIPDDPDAFSSKPRWARFLVMVAGAVFNVILALVIWTGLSMYGIHVPDESAEPPTIGAVTAEGPADRAGLLPGDQLLAVGGETIDSPRTYIRAVLLSPGATLDFEIRREGQRLVLPVTIGVDEETPQRVGSAGIALRVPQRVKTIQPGSVAESAGFRVGDQFLAIAGTSVNDQQDVIDLVQASSGAMLSFTISREGETLTLDAAPELEEDGQWRIGVSYGASRYLRMGFWAALQNSASMAWGHAADLYYTLRKLVLAQISIRMLSGPIEIASYLKQTAELGFAPLLSFMAWISLQLGIINLLPIPVLDGGHILVLFVEGVSRRNLSLKLKERIMIAGLVFLLVVMTAVIGMDVLKLIEKSGG